MQMCDLCKKETQELENIKIINIRKLIFILRNTHTNPSPIDVKLLSQTLTNNERTAP